jgi:hypothetical protein
MELRCEGGFVNSSHQPSVICGDYMPPYSSSNSGAPTTPSSGPSGALQHHLVGPCSSDAQQTLLPPPISPSTPNSSSNNSAAMYGGANNGAMMAGAGVNMGQHGMSCSPIMGAEDMGVVMGYGGMDGAGLMGVMGQMSPVPGGTSLSGGGSAEYPWMKEKKTARGKQQQQHQQSGLFAL